MLVNKNSSNKKFICYQGFKYVFDSSGIKKPNERFMTSRLRNKLNIIIPKPNWMNKQKIWYITYIF